MPVDLLVPPPSPPAELDAPTIAAPDVDLAPEAAFSMLERGVTLAFVLLPAVAVVLAMVRVWGEGVSLRDIAIAVALYFVAGYGVTVGFHRMLTHRSFRPSRPLKVIMAISGSMAFEGGPIGWVADHRRHHIRSDRPGDPHSPHEYGEGKHTRLRGLAHAHVGWLFSHTPNKPQRDARDMLADRDIVWIDRLFPLWCVVSLAVPFGLGYLLGRGLAPALTALLWAGGVRIFVQHHVTWSINSICHTIGKRPMRTNDRSGNVAALAVASMGESWHNGHHALPRSARHGLLPHQWDSSARLISWFEHVGWATDVVWPTRKQILASLVTADTR
jgi:stearoyl-CoA desaturase (delta-9 desaturase)